jgi:hypothetical protein
MPTLPPADALTDLLPPDVDLSSGSGLRHEAAVPVWYGVVWSRLGRGDLAWEHWDGVGVAALAPWIAAERGRTLREVGLHAAAEQFEGPALRLAEDPVDAAMLCISLAADAVGSLDVEAARRRFAAAEAAIAAAPDGPRAARQRLRLAWVRVEVAYLTGQRPTGEALPVWDEAADRPTFSPDHDWGSRFHTAKGLLFAGVVRSDDRLLHAAATIAPPALLWAVQLARADRGTPGSMEAAQQAWRAIVPPPGSAAAVAASPTSRRLTGHRTTRT